jgi:alanine dehydrogenase
MNIGVAKEIKPGEGRVAITPDGVRELVAAGAAVFIEHDAGRLSGFPDEDYTGAGARILEDEASVFDAADVIVKVKEVLPPELPLIRARHVILAFHHSRMFNETAAKILAAGCTAVAWEDIVLPDGSRPILRPMSEIAGKLGFIKAIEYLQSIRGGSGRLPVALDGIAPPVVVILGAGVAGTAAAQTAVALGNTVHVVEKDASRRAAIKKRLLSVEVHESTGANVSRLVREADVLLNATAIGAYAKTHLVTRDMLKTMKRSAIIVDVSCDIAGGVETCRLTSHADPVYEVDGIRHYCVDNIPAAVSATSTRALCRETLPYVKSIATKGLSGALRADPALARAVSYAAGKVTSPDLATTLGVPCHDVIELL